MNKIAFWKHDNDSRFLNAGIRRNLERKNNF